MMLEDGVAAVEIPALIEARFGRNAAVRVAFEPRKSGDYNPTIDLLKDADNDDMVKALEIAEERGIDHDDDSTIYEIYTWVSRSRRGPATPRTMACTTYHAPRTTYHAPRTTHQAPRTTHHDTPSCEPTTTATTATTTTTTK